MPFDGTHLDEATKLLITAREMIERGWCQNKIAIGGAVCAVGALTRTVSAHALSGAALGSAIARLEQAIGFCAITIWNDDPERTQADVLAAYDIAIAASLSGSA